jgi:hypothetical protein
MRSIIRSGSLRRWPAWLALFAVLLQFAASVGHLHPEDYSFLLRGHHAAIVTANNHGFPAPWPLLKGDADCAICATARLIGSSSLPPVVTLPLPTHGALATVLRDEALRLVAPDHLLFTTRGPPIA